MSMNMEQDSGRHTGLLPSEGGRSSTVILHSESAYLLSFLLLQNLLICKSIAYIFGSIHHTYIFVLYIDHKGGAGGGKQILAEFLKKMRKEKSSSQLCAVGRTIHFGLIVRPWIHPTISILNDVSMILL